jgi:hypothetical protein
MDSATYQRAAVSAALWFVVEFAVSSATGEGLSMGNAAVDAALMGVSSVGSDTLHRSLMWQSSGVSSAVATGGLYAVIQRFWRNDSNYLVNVALAGANEYAVEKYWDYQQQQRWYAAQQDAIEESM